jgi:hypothetical protein
MKTLFLLSFTPKSRDFVPRTRLYRCTSSAPLA